MLLAAHWASSIAWNSVESRRRVINATWSQLVRNTVTYRSRATVGGGVALADVVVAVKPRRALLLRVTDSRMVIALGSTLKR